MGGPSDRLRPQPSLLVLEILVAEIRAKDPTIPLPEAARVEEVGRSGRLDSVEAQRLLAELELKSKAAGLDFPAPLRVTMVSGGAGTTPPETAP